MDKPTLKVFEAFAGIGAQASALEKLNINYEITGISDWFIDAIECYAAIHCNNEVNIEIPSTKAEIVKELNRYVFSADSVHPYDISKLSFDKLISLYRANKISKNYGSITEIEPQNMPEVDLLVYSFPCQDLSTGGLGKGMKKGSGTRSGLLWEIEKILIGLKELNRLPEYLLLENVKTIKASSNKQDLDQWLLFLESIGYKNDDIMLLNSLDFGVPQDRERAFIVSHLGSKLNVKKKIQPQKREYNFDSFFRNDYDNPILKAEADIAQLNDTPSRKKMWEINGRELNENWKALTACIRTRSTTLYTET